MELALTSPHLTSPALTVVRCRTLSYTPRSGIAAIDVELGRYSEFLVREVDALADSNLEPLVFAIQKQIRVSRLGVDRCTAVRWGFWGGWTGPEGGRGWVAIRQEAGT